MTAPGQFLLAIDIEWQAGESVSGCRCRLCEPGPLNDDLERACVETVREHGWQVNLVGEGDGDDEPAFAYTVGLGHRARHPELVMSGLPSDLMHRVLNAMVERIAAGHRFDTPGQLVEAALARVAVTVEPLTEDGLRQTVTWSGWFHRRSPRAVQLVWPDTAGVFAWQDGAPDVLDRRQPPTWREPGPRTGFLAPVPAWVMPVPGEALVFSCTHVLEDGEPVLFATREPAAERGEDWTFHCGKNGHSTDTIRLTHLHHIVAAAPSVADQLSDLPLEHSAARDGSDEPWTVTPDSAPPVGGPPDQSHPTATKRSRWPWRKG